MGGHVDLRFVGWRWERDPPQVRILSGIPQRRWTGYGSRSRFPDEPEAGRNQSTQRIKGHSSSAGGADGIDVEICHPYVFEARRGMLFEQTDETP